MALEKFDLKIIPELIKSLTVLIVFSVSSLIDPGLLVTKLFIAQSLINIFLVLSLYYLPSKLIRSSFKSSSAT
jgi:hypothetical protein